MIAGEKNPDQREQAIRQQFPEDYAYIRSMIYPQLRAVNFRYNLRRKGMVKDTIHTTELDTTYMRGVELLQKRKYARALYILNDYNDRNTVVAHLLMDHNERALELLATMPKDAVVEYLRATRPRDGSIFSKRAAWTGAWSIGEISTRKSATF